MSAVAPGILTLPGGSHALAVNYPGGALNAKQNPVHPGEYVVVYLTGQGVVDHTVASGAESPADPLLRPLAARWCAIFQGSPLNTWQEPLSGPAPLVRFASPGVLREVPALRRWKRR